MIKEQTGCRIVPTDHVYSDLNVLTHWSLVTPYGILELGKHQAIT